VGVKRRNEAGRYEGTEEFNYFLSVIFPAASLKIFDYNRLVKDLNGYSVDEFLKKVESELGAVELYQGNGPFRPTVSHTMGMYVGKRWYVVKFHDCVLKGFTLTERLDCAILQKYLLAPVLGIEDPRTDKRIDFVGGIRGLQYLEEYCLEDGVAMAMYPTSMDELISVADANEQMPPKSTWFEPKLRSGILIHKI
jgi:uncharacterized protein (DUF1015 family)